MDDEWDVEEAPLSPLDTLKLAKNRCVELLKLINGEIERAKQNIQYAREMLELADANFVSITDARDEARFSGVSDRDVHAVLGDLPRDSYAVIEELKKMSA